MPLNFFNDIFLLNFTLETSQSAFERLAILKMDFCQFKIHLPLRTNLSIPWDGEQAAACYIENAWKL